MGLGLKVNKISRKYNLCSHYMLKYKNGNVYKGFAS